MSVDGFSNRWKDFPDYIIGITKEIWEGRGVDLLDDYYAEDIPVRTPMGVSKGRETVKTATLATLNEFPDRELFGEDVLWCGNSTAGFLSSHRIISTGTHSGNGAFGAATGKTFKIRVIADCAARADQIYDEWLVRDYGGLVRQLGFNPKTYAGDLIKREGGAEQCSKPFTPAIDIEGPYKSRGNDNGWGTRYAATLKSIMELNLEVIERDYDRAVLSEYAGSVSGISLHAVSDFWLGLRSSFPNATFQIHHQLGMDNDMLPPRAAIRWSLDGVHEGEGHFGPPTGAHVHVMGIAHAEYGPFVAHGSSIDASIRRECALYDEVAIWKQILIQTGDL